MATADTELVEEISSELLLVKAENIQLREVIVAKDSVIRKLTQGSNSKQTRIRAQRLINKKLAAENKDLLEKVEAYSNPLATCRDYCELVQGIPQEGKR